jgi:hypothetical protein
VELDFDIPPVSSCAVCGQPGCPGCVRSPAKTEARLEGGIRFEQPRGSLSERLVQTALESVSDPAQMFGIRLRGASRRHAWAFAWLSEGLALLSVFAFCLGIFSLGFPKISRELLSLRGAYVVVLLAYVFAVAFLVLVHWLWGLALDFGMAGRVREEGELSAEGVSARALGVQFGLYACGWDLITSPLGLVLVWRNVPRGARGDALLGALRAPQVAIRVYFVAALALSEAEARVAQRRALALALGWLGITFLVVLGGSFWFLWRSALGLAG